jgi:four helix bundle protein
MQNAECRMQNEVTMEQNPVVDKSFRFAVRIVNLYKYMIREHKEYVLSKQILRCGTSIGANIAEGQRGQSKADFAAKMNIALKEANETEYWLRLLHETDYLSKEQYKSLHTDIHELISLLMAICRTANDKK